MHSPGDTYGRIPGGGHWVNAMPATDFEQQRRQMLAEISATTAGVRGMIGKAALDERVMRAVGKVPRHEFVPMELQRTPMPIAPFRLALTRPSRNHLLSP